MFSFPTPSVYQTSKCFFTYGTMGHPDLKQLPVKGKPWSSLLALDFIHKVDLILPYELLEVVREKLLGDPSRVPTFHRVTMTLGQVLEGGFFTQYLKIGNILMLSEGRIDADNVFSIREGLLTLYLDREAYERAGLVGKPYGAKGDRGLKPRWIVQFNLRSPSMLHGKKGFDRLVYACKNVLNRPTLWLFCNLSETPAPDPLAQHFPTKYTSSPSLEDGLTVKIPPLNPPAAILEERNRFDLDEYATDIYEWLSLVRLESPRLDVNDAVDPYLSTYAIPGDSETANEGRLCHISWQGFLSASWARQTLASLVHALPARAWFAMSATSFSRGIVGTNTDCTIMRPPESPGEYVLWEIKSHE
ncbi:ribonuclease P 40kDa subunit [Xylariaceae sp. FL0804]|nr:ribonuclease P 40kDa subunit [Xylariaceae sp. FL0804]